jgi:hypothetical protein
MNDADRRTHSRTNHTRGGCSDASRRESESPEGEVNIKWRRLTVHFAMSTRIEFVGKTLYAPAGNGGR